MRKTSALLSELMLIALLGCATAIDDTDAPLHLTLEQIIDDPNIYRPCDSPGSDCGPVGAERTAQCSSLGAGLHPMCLPGTGLGIAETDTAYDDCPPLVGPYTQKRLHNVSCVIECSGDASAESACPIELPHCQVNPFSAASRYEAQRFCVFEVSAKRDLTLR
jgi:hypothetical protein